MQCQAGAWLAQRYKLLQQLFQDGPMEYWQAQWQDPAGYGGEAILQVPLAIFLQHPERLRQWQRQTEYIHALQHPNVIRLYELGQEEDLHFLASEPTSGVSLYQVIQYFRAMEQPVPWAQATYLLARICEGLQFAHSCLTSNGEPIYHGDLRPENIILTPLGEIKIQHFGHLHLWGDLLEAWPIQIKRRCAYAAPERWQQTAPFTPASDLFSIGVLILELLTQEIPHMGASIEAIQKSMLAPAAQTSLQQSPHIPKTLGDLSQQLLSVSPAMRLGSAQDVQQLLEHVLRTQGLVISSRDLRELYQQVAPPDPFAPNAASQFDMAPSQAPALLPLLAEESDDYFDNAGPPTLIASDLTNHPFGLPQDNFLLPKKRPPATIWDPFEGEDYIADAAGESTMIQPNLLLEFQRSLQENEANVEVSLRMDPLDPRSRDDLEAPLDLFANESDGIALHRSAQDLPAPSLHDPFGQQNAHLSPFDRVEDIDSVIELDVDDVEDVEELEPIEIEDPGEATFLQSSPLPEWSGRPAPDNGPATIQGGLSPETMAMLANAEAEHGSPRRSSSQIPIAGGGSPAIATIRPASNDALLSAQRDGKVRTHQFGDLLQPSLRNETPVFQLDQTPASPSFDGLQANQERPLLSSPMNLGSLGGQAPDRPIFPSASKPSSGSKKWLWLLLLPLIGGGGGTGAWFLWLHLQRPTTPSLDAGNTITLAPLPPRPEPPRAVVDAGPPAPRTPDIRPLPLMLNPPSRPKARANKRRRKSRRTKVRRAKVRRRKTKRPRVRPRAKARLVARANPIQPRPEPRRQAPSGGESGAMLLIKPTCTVYNERDIKGSSSPTLRVTLAPGSYNFHCINRSKRILHRFRLRIESGNMFNYKRTLRPGKLLLRSEPWGSISVKGIGNIGKTGEVQQLYEGTYTLTIYKKGSKIPGPGLRKTMRITIVPGQVTKPPLYKFPVLDDE